MSYYVTKYALTDGVLVIPKDRAEIFADGRGLKWGRWFSSAHGKGKDWHDSRESAEKRVAAMKVRKRASLQKSLAKLDEPVKFKEWNGE